MKKTVVIGATPNPSRYAYMAVERLKNHGFEVIPLGIREGLCGGLNIMTGRPDISDVHTVTLYVNPQVQKDWYTYILKLKPTRIIFNPGTENPEFSKMASESGIQCEEACTLVLLSTEQF